MTHFIEILENNAKQQQYGDKIAVKAKNPSDSLTYHQFNQRINQYANYLRDKYPDDGQPFRIAIVYERSLEMLLLMLAAWKINASFMLIDAENLKNPGSVQNKIRRMKPRLIATALEHVKHDEFEGHHDFLSLNDVATQKEIANCKSDFTFVIPKKNTEAYIVATSGSTGEPKLVVVEHTVRAGSGLAAVFFDLSKLMKLGTEDTVLLDGAINWDPIICMIGVGLYNGSALYIASAQEKIDKKQLLQTCADHNINVMLIVPSAVDEVEKQMTSLKKIPKLWILFTGEELTPKIVNTFKDVTKNGGIVNGYGPCEGPIGITATIVKSAEDISIHRPMQGREWDIIPIEKSDLQPNTGELIWCAEGFAGYLGDPKSTREKMIENHKGKSFWHSRDKVSLNNGILTYLGRIDKQFKVWAVLVNPADIKTRLQNFDITAYAIAIKSQYTNTLRPVVFYKQTVPSIAESDIKMKLKDIPLVKLVCLKPEEHHLTTNEKTDENALRNIYLNMIAQRPQPGNLSEFLQNVWCEILDVTNVKNDDNFNFLGGDSLKFKELQTAISGSSFLKAGGFDSSEIKSFWLNPTFGNLLDLAQNIDRSHLFKHLHRERLEAPFVIIDGDPNQDYSQIMPESPLILLRTTDPTASTSEREQDAKKTLKRMGIVDRYYMAMLNGHERVSVNKLRNALFRHTTLAHGLYPRLVRYWKDCLLTDLHHHIQCEMNRDTKDDLEKALQIQSKELKLNREMIFRNSTDTIVFLDPTTAHRPYAREFLGELIDYDVQPLLLEVPDDGPIDLVDLFKQVNLYAQHMKMIVAKGMAMDIALVFTNIKKPEQVKQIQEQIFAWHLGGCRKILICNPQSHQEQDFTQHASYFRVHRPTFINTQPIADIPVKIKHPNYAAITTIYNAAIDKQTLFAFAPLTGEEVYQPLSEQLSVQLISLSHPWLADSISDLPTSFNSLDELSQFYADAVEHYQPGGAIALCGWSFGGLVAAAVAEQLRLRGRNMYYVGIIDTTHPATLTKQLEDVTAHRQLLQTRLNWLMKTYHIPATDDYLAEVARLPLNNLADADKIWQAFIIHIDKQTTLVNPAYVRRVIQICRQNYQFSFAQFPMPTDSDIVNVYEAKKLVLDNEMRSRLKSQFINTDLEQLFWNKFLFQHSDESDLGWNVKRTVIFDTDHFTIHQSPILADMINKRMSDAEVLAQADIPSLRR